MSARVIVGAVIIAFATAGCHPRRAFDEGAIKRAVLGQGLSPRFMLGVATSAYQIEGGNDADWTTWENTGFANGAPHIEGGQHIGLSVDSWNRWPEDIADLQKLGANAYRLSIEWSRLVPAEGAWDEAALAHYREELIALRAAGITPLVTVQHFALPGWVAARGGWEWEGITPALADYARRLGASLGDLVDDWVTINEPNAVVAAGYTAGSWPPGVSDNKRAMAVYARLLHAHAACAKALRAGDTADADGDGSPTFIGLAHNIVIIQPASSSPLDALFAGAADDLVNEVVPRAAKTGWIKIAIPGVIEINEYDDDLKGSFDYLGINYYQRNYLRADLSAAIPADAYVPADRPTSEMGWEIYAQGFYEVLTRFGRYGWPIIVTENGIADANDEKRPAFLRSHFYAMQAAIEDGARVLGYFHWTLMDNFEWAYGFDAKMGLFEVDFGDPALPRRPRQSAQVFREMARGMGLTPASL